MEVNSSQDFFRDMFHLMSCIVFVWMEWTLWTGSLPVYGCIDSHSVIDLNPKSLLLPVVP